MEGSPGEYSNVPFLARQPPPHPRQHRPEGPSYLSRDGNATDCVPLGGGIKPIKGLTFIVLFVKTKIYNLFSHHI